MRLVVFGFFAFSFALASAAHAVVVTVNGTSNADTIYVGDEWTGCNDGCSICRGGTDQGVHARVNGTLTALSVPSGAIISVNGLAGDDFVEFINSTDGFLNLSSFGRSCLRPITSVSSYTTQIDGGADVDEIHGSDHVDLICGGAGDDLLYGRGADDLVAGDQCTCQDSGASGCPDCETAGDDTCYGDAGNDEVFCDALANGGTGTDDCDGAVTQSCELNSCFTG